jgi:hypothetical protein
MYEHDDDEDGASHEAISSILDMLDKHGGKLMHDKHGPKEPVPPPHGAAVHSVHVTVVPHGAKPEHAAPADETGLTHEMLEHLLGEPGDEEEEHEEK